MGFDTLESPVNLEFIWYAKYTDGTLLTEYNTDGIKTELSSVDKTKLSEFGLFGRKNKLYINTSDGIFHFENENNSILNKKIEMYFIDNAGLKTSITENSALNYTNIIALKGFFVDVVPGQTKAVGYINKFVFGYNLNIVLPKGTLSARIVFELEYGLSHETMKIKLSPNGFNLVGDLYIIEDGTTINSPYRFSLSGTNVEEIDHSFNL